MGREQLRSRTFWILVAIVAAAGGIAAACLIFHRELPGRFLRSLAFGLGVFLALWTAIGVALIVSLLREPPADPRARYAPTGGQPVWFTREGTGAAAEVLMPAGPVVTLGSAPDATVRLAALAEAHARVRIWPHVVDVSRLGRGAVRVDGRSLPRGAWRELEDGAVLELGGERVRVHVGWTPDPADPRVGTRLGPHLLTRRLGDTPRGTRYLARAAVVERLERQPMTDAELAGYAAASRAAHAHTPAIAPVLETLRDPGGAPVLCWPLAAATELGARLASPEAVHSVCERLAGLHAAGMAHGALTPSHLLPGDDRGAQFAAALPAPPRDSEADGAPYRAAAAGLRDDEAAFLAPEVRAGAPATAPADVFALATFLERSLGHLPHRRDAPAWRALLDAAQAAAPAARPANAGQLAREILRAAARTDPRGHFADRTFARCEHCGEHLVAREPVQETMFDGIGPGGRAVGGRHRVWPARCLGCDRDATREETERY